MALKDWKKQTNMNYGWRKGNQLVRVYYLNGKYYLQTPYTNFKPTDYKTNKLLKMAKSYMRKH